MCLCRFFMLEPASNHSLSCPSPPTHHHRFPSLPCLSVCLPAYLCPHISFRGLTLELARQLPMLQRPRRRRLRRMTSTSAAAVPRRPPRPPSAGRQGHPLKRAAASRPRRCGLLKRRPVRRAGGKGQGARSRSGRGAAGGWWGWI